MLVWLLLIGGSSLCGLLVAIFCKQAWAVYLAGAIPWSLLLAALLFTVYLQPSEATDAPMWLIAQLVGGTIAAVCGIMAFKAMRHLMPVAED